MKKIRTRLAALLASLAVLAGVGVVTAAPAEAFTTFYYDANCPGNARYQQLVIRDFSRSGINVDAKAPLFQSTWRFLGTTSPNGGGTIHYLPVQHYDYVAYRLYGPGNLDWYYHVSCYY